MNQLEIQFDIKKLDEKRLSYSKRLELLSNIDLSFIGENGRIALHNVHSFPAKFPPQLPHIFIELLTKENDVVLDPMMGSCTTLIEALRLKRVAYGCDIDPLAILIAKAKLTSIDISEIINRGKTIINRAYKNKNCVTEKELKDYFDEKTYEFVNYWFKKETQIELFSIIKEIEKIKEDGIKNFLRMIFSSIIIAKSGGVSLALDLAHTRPHLVKGKKIPSSYEEFNKKLSLVSKNVHLFDDPKVSIYQADAKNIPLDADSVDLIVTSPPYANNAIDYLRAHKFSLVWFGNTLDNISKVRNIFIGSNSTKGIDNIIFPKMCNDVISMVQKKDIRKGLSLKKYYSEMFGVIKEMHRVLRKKKVAVIVVATSNIKGIDSKTHLCLAEIGTEIGFKLIGINKRQLDRDKRMMPTRWNQNKNSQIESRMHEEYVIIFQKT